MAPSTNLTPEQRRQRARIAINTRWSRVPRAERAAATEAARAAVWQRYLDAVPAEVTDPAERARLARQARRADLERMSLRAARARTTRAILERAGSDSREAAAIAGYACPVCGRAPGKRCGSPASLSGGRPMTRPHPERVELADADRKAAG